MVAYSFKTRFVPKIKAGIKPCTIRAGRGPRSNANGAKDRHAYADEPITLLTGPRMRPEHLGKTTCTKRAPIILRWRPAIEIIEDGEKLPEQSFDRFAVEDGFDDMDDMARFWCEVHGAIEVFTGVHLYWDPAPIAAFWKEREAVDA